MTPWSVILSDTSFAVHNTYHTMLQATPVQLVSGFDVMLNTPFIADWGDISRRKQQLIDKIIKTKIKIAKRTVI